MLVTISLLPSAAALVKNVSPEGNALVDKGIALDSLGNYTGAIAYYDKVLSIDPKNVAALSNKGNALGSLGNYTGAIAYYDKVLSIDPTDVFALYDKGVVLDALGNHTGAIQYYDKALDLDPRNVGVLTFKGLALDSLGKYTEAISSFDKALAIDPKNVNALHNKGVALDKLLGGQPGTESQLGGNMSIFKNSTLGFSIEYPANWIYITRSEPISDQQVPFTTFGNPETPSLYFLIFRLQFPNSIPLDIMNQLAPQIAHQYIPQYQILRQGQTELAGKPAGFLIFTGTEQQQPVKLAAIWTVADNRVYFLIFEAPSDNYDKYFSTVKKMFASFKILPASSEPSQSGQGSASPNPFGP
jgi:Flp pilus assembly protein TadD